MKESIEEVEKALKTLGKGSPWGVDTKVSDDLLTPLFEKFFRSLGISNIMAKKNFHELAHLVPENKLDPEIKEKLDAIVSVAKSAKPVSKA